MAEPEQVSLVNVQAHDLFKKLVQRLVRMRHNERLLVREVVVDVRDDLYGDVRFTSAWRTDDHRQAWLHSGPDRFDLRGGEVDRVGLGLVVRVGSPVKLLVRLDVDLCLVSEGELEGRYGLVLGVGQFNLVLGERLHEMVVGQEGVVEVQGADGLFDLGVVGSGWVAVAEQEVPQPVGHHKVGVHEVADALEHRLEVACLWVAAHEHVEARIDVLDRWLGQQQVRVFLVLVRVQEDAQRALRAAELVAFALLVVVVLLVCIKKGLELNLAFNGTLKFGKI